MSRRRISLIVFSSLMLVLAACRPREPVEVTPAEGPPGTTAVVRVPGLEEIAKEAVEVSVGDRPAAVLAVDARAGVEFLVPEHPPGAAEVAVRIDGRAVGRVPFTVRPSPARQLVLAMSGEEIELVASRGAVSLDRPSRELPSRRALSYDVVTSDGRLVATGVIPHPLADRREVLEPDGTLRGAPEPVSATFTLRIPSVPRGGVVRFYEVEPGTDPESAEGRAARRLISEIRVEDQQ
jgi:hypothetical protein